MKQLFPFSINSPMPMVKNVSHVTSYGYNDNGKDILDLSLGSCGSFPLGFKRTDIIDYVNDKMKTMSFCPGDYATSNEYVVELSEKLFNLSNGFYPMYSLSGSDSVEGALKLAHMYHKKNPEKKKIIGFKKSYHGSTYMSTSVSGNEAMINYFGRQEDCVNIWHDEIETHIDSSTKAVIIETMSWANNLQPLDDSFFIRLRKLCDEHDCLLIVDDIAFCGGKTGTILGIDVLPIRPDIFCLGKGISGGYFPLSITLCNQKVADIVKPQFLLHGFTYSFPMPGILSALKYLSIIEDESILDKHGEVVSMGNKVMNDLLEKNLIKDYNRFGCCYSINPLNPIKDTAVRDKLYYDNGLHMGLWNNDSRRLLVMCPIIPDVEYFTSLHNKLLDCFSPKTLL